MHYNKRVEKEDLQICSLFTNIHGEKAAIKYRKRALYGYRC